MSDPIHTLAGHTDSVQSVVFSPDGSRLCSGAADSSIRLWDITTGKLVRIFQSSSADVQSIAVSPDGDRIAWGTADGSISLLKISNGNLLWTSREHTDWVKQVVFSPDGTIIASSSADESVKLWRAPDGELLHTLHTGAIQTLPGGLFFSPDSLKVTITNANGMFTFGVTDGSLLNQIQWLLFASGVAFSPDKSRMVSRFFVNFVSLWDLLPDSRALRSKIEGHEGVVFSVAFSPDGGILATGSTDKTVRIWEVCYGLHLQTFVGHRSTVFSVDFSPDSKTLASGSDDKTIRIWRLKN